MISSSGRSVNFAPHRLADLLVPVVILATALAAVTTNDADPDLWGHVEYGREVLRDRALPSTATWTFAAEGARWINHENIAELVLATTVDQFGPGGLTWMKLGIAAMIFGLMMISARKSGAGWTATAIMVLLAAANMQFHWHFRPQILTYLCLAVLLALWEQAFAGPRAEDSCHGRWSEPRLVWLLPIPVLMCFWANSHGGFAAGLAILATCHGLLSVQLLCAGKPNARRSTSRLMLISLASFAATLVNPYGWELWQFMIEAIRLPRPEISDWGFAELWTTESLRLWSLMLISAGSLWFDRKRRNPAQLTIFCLLLWQGLSHCRHLSILAIVCGFWIPRHLHAIVANAETTLMQLNSRFGDPVERNRRRTIGSVAMISLLFADICRLAPLMGDVIVDRREFPVAAMQFMHERELHGKVVVPFNWAQYAIGCFAAEKHPARRSRVAVDGRFETCYPREITDIYFDFWFGTADPSRRYRSPTTAPFDPARALEFCQPDFVLLSRLQLPSIREMHRHENEWVLLYQDSLSQIWGRRALCDDPSSRLHLPQIARRISDDPQTGTVPWPALPKSNRHNPRLTSMPITGQSSE